MLVEENIYCLPCMSHCKTVFFIDLNFTQTLIKLNTVSLKQLGNVMEQQEWAGALEFGWEEGCCGAQDQGAWGILGHSPWWPCQGAKPCHSLRARLHGAVQDLKLHELSVGDEKECAAP